MNRERHYIHGDLHEGADQLHYCATRDLFVPAGELLLGEQGLRRYKLSRKAATRRNATRWRVVLDDPRNPYV